ncbi:hypothetical protein [Solitalea canadensis]|uniref:hypothetical protein n=1 Tax=Solitalea canadensis TaxID=995 RepID=UPI0002D688BC|nr:hypothetical protein [Solitalea canadensis]
MGKRFHLIVEAFYFLGFADVFRFTSVNPIELAKDFVGGKEMVSFLRENFEEV